MNNFTQSREGAKVLFLGEPLRAQRLYLN